MTSVAVLALGAVMMGLMFLGYLRKRLFRCPDCGFRSDHDHIVEASEEAPYCAYCGAHMRYVGRRWDAWRARVLGTELPARRPATDVEGESIREYLLGWLER